MARGRLPSVSTKPPGAHRITPRRHHASRACRCHLPVLRRDRLTSLDDDGVDSANISARAVVRLDHEAVAPSIVGFSRGLTPQCAHPVALVGCSLARWVLLEAHADDDRIDLYDEQAQRHALGYLTAGQRQARVVDAHDLAGLPGARWVYGFHGAYLLPSKVSASPHRFGSRVPQMLT